MTRRRDDRRKSEDRRGGNRRHAERGGAPRPPEAAGAPGSEPTSRGAAIEILLRLESSGNERAADRLARIVEERTLSARDARFASELVHGVLRRRLTLDCIIGAYSRRPVAELDGVCLQALRIGTYQLVFLDAVPAFAAIGETMRAIGREHEGVRSAVNGILRAIDREANRMAIDRDRGGSSPRRRLPIGDRKVVYFPRDVFCAPEESLELYLGQIASHPPPIVGRWLRRFSREEVDAILAADNSKPRLTARVNVTKGDRDATLERLRSEGVLAGPGDRPDAILFGSPIDAVAGCSAFREGRFYLQDETAMSVAEELEPRPDERILDLCAAPGGKTTHLAELTAGRARILANDRDESRLERLRANIERLGVQNIECVASDPLAGAPEADRLLAGPFDAVLVDAPCSNTGVLRRRPEARWRVDVPSILSLADQSRALLDFAARRVKPGGRIVYSTCSIEHEENAENARRFLVAHPGFTLKRERLTLQRADGPDGGYVATFERTGGA